MSEHSGVTGKTPHQVARAESLREITDAEMVRGRINDLRGTFRTSGRTKYRTTREGCRGGAINCSDADLGDLARNGADGYFHVGIEGSW